MLAGVGCGRDDTTPVFNPKGVTALGSEGAIAPRPKGDNKKVPTREEFKAAVTGKTAEEVLRAVGKPDRTSEHLGRQYWYYERASRDTITDKVDVEAQVTFEDGVALSVSF